MYINFDLYNPKSNKCKKKAREKKGADTSIIRMYVQVANQGRLSAMVKKIDNWLFCGPSSLDYLHFMQNTEQLRTVPGNSKKEGDFM